MKPKTLTQFKFLKQRNHGFVSKFGGEPPWVIGRWRSVKGKIILCARGYHCSPTPAQAHRYIATNILAAVQVRGDHKMWNADSITHNEKSAWRSMRVVGIYRVRMADYRAYLKFVGKLAEAVVFYEPTLVGVLRQCRDLEQHALHVRGKRIQNLAAITAWWVLRLPEMQVVA